VAKTSSEAERKLTAVFVTDVVGYSRLMGDDHDATAKTFAEYRAVFSDYIQQHKGRVVNPPGDSILAEFSSVVDAVNCAVEIQRELGEKNTELSDDRRMDFRIGINLGDVVEMRKRTAYKAAIIQIVIDGRV
jgi:class 3 adenylate cyclase